MKTLSKGENLNDLIATSAHCLLQFGDAACTPCVAIRERLTRWLECHPGITARYIPVGEFQEASAQMGVFTAPTVRFYMEGKLVADERGYFSLDYMLAKIERYLDMEI